VFRVTFEEARPKFGRAIAPPSKRKTAPDFVDMSKICLRPVVDKFVDGDKLCRCQNGEFVWALSKNDVSGFGMNKEEDIVFQKVGAAMWKEQEYIK